MNTIRKPNTINSIEKIRFFEDLLSILLGNNYIREPMLKSHRLENGHHTYSTPDYVYPNRQVVIEYKQTITDKGSRKVGPVKHQAGYYASEIAATGYPKTNLLWWTFGTDGKKWIVRPYICGVPQQPWETLGYYDMFPIVAQLPPDRPLTDRDRSIWQSAQKNGLPPNLSKAQ